MMFQRAAWLTDPRMLGLMPMDRYRDLDAPKAPRGVANVHALFRKSFSVPKAPGKAVVLVSGDDCYRLYVNGQFVGLGPAPGYPFHYYFNSFDVTPLLKPGENVIAAHVYYQGLVNRVYNSGDNRCGLIAELFLDGKSAIQTDGTWRYAPDESYGGDATIGYQTQFLENLDNRVKSEGWTAPRFDDSAWQSAPVVKTDHVLYPQPTANIALSIERPPIKEARPEGLFIDMGGEVVGCLNLRVHAPAGALIRVQCAEELDEAGLPRSKMRCNCHYLETWTTRAGEQTFDPWDYKGFRYALITAGPEVAIRDVFVETRGYPHPGDASLVGHELLGRLFAMCDRTMRYGIQDGFLDCPTREKGQYLGDLTVSGATFLYMNGDARLYLKALEQYAQSAAVTPSLLSVAPGSLRQEIADYSLQYPSQVLRYYDFTGDLSAVARLFGAVSALRERMRQYEREDGLIENVTDMWNMIDWPKNLRDGYDLEVDENREGVGFHNLVNAYYIGMLQDVNRIRALLGLPSEDVAGRVSAFNAAFFSAGRTLYMDRVGSQHASLHANVLPLYFGIAPAGVHEALCAFIMDKGLCCGVYFSFFVLKALARAGRHDLCYELLVNQGEHSFANMLREGATTALEAWGLDQKWNTSLCHPWGTALVPVLIEDLFGALPKRPGYKGFTPVDHLPAPGDIAVTFHTGAGLVTVQRENGAVRLITS